MRSIKKLYIPCKKLQLSWCLFRSNMISFGRYIEGLSWSWQDFLFIANIFLYSNRNPETMKFMSNLRSSTQSSTQQSSSFLTFSYISPYISYKTGIYSHINVKANVSQTTKLKTFPEEQYQQQYSSQFIIWQLLETIDGDFKTALCKNHMLRKGEF